MALVGTYAGYSQPERVLTLEKTPTTRVCCMGQSRSMLVLQPDIRHLHKTLYMPKSREVVVWISSVQQKFPRAFGSVRLAASH